MEKNLEKIRNFFKADRWASGAGIVIDSADDETVQCSMEIRDIHRNAGGAVQGGAIFTLADLAFAVHCNLELASGEDRGITVGQSCSISFLKSSRGTRLIARSRCLSRGKSISVYRISISDDLGAPIAEMIGNSFSTVKKDRGPAQN
ncbi:MAG: PaaI family thioesterase [Treponema sp.]|nr:PaaI family thioesterase [Treponema sp.]